MRLGTANDRPGNKPKETDKNITRSLNNWRKYRQTVNELGRMSNRELHDVGINRSDIAAVARSAIGG